MMRSVEHLHDADLATIAVFRAYINWREYRGAWADALAYFRSMENRQRFVSGYGVLRGESDAVRKAIWTRLLDEGALIAAVRDDTGAGIDRLAEELLGLPGTTKRHMSFCSKLAALAKPASFVATDIYNRRGLARAKLIRRGQAIAPASYVEMLAATMKAHDMFRDLIEATIRKHAVETPTKIAFELRTLDCYLMGLGGFEEKRRGKTTA